MNMSDRGKQIPYAFPHMWNTKKKKRQSKINEQTNKKYREQNSGYQREGVEENEMGKGEHL